MARGIGSGEYITSSPNVHVAGMTACRGRVPDGRSAPAKGLPSLTHPAAATTRVAAAKDTTLTRTGSLTNNNGRRGTLDRSVGRGVCHGHHQAHVPPKSGAATSLTLAVYCHSLLGIMQGDHLARSPLGDEFPNGRHEFDGHLHRGVRRRFICRLVLGDGLVVGLFLVVLQDSLNASGIPTFGESRCAHGFFRRRRRRACRAFGLRSNAVMQQTLSGSGSAT